MSIPTLFDEKELKRRIYKVYSGMKHSAKPKLFKAGPRQKQIRVPGLTELPFTPEQLWRHALIQVGPGAMRCQYCEAIGKPANVISLATCVFDHKVPKAHAGRELTLVEVWSLPNIFAVCQDCNTLKGDSTYAFFIGHEAALESWKDPRDRSYIRRCLRTHGKVMQGRRDFNKNKPAPPANEYGTMRSLPLVEDF